MDAIQAIMTRRSVRRFAGGPVEEAAVEALLRAAMQAPSAHNNQPWHFVVIRERKTLEEVPRFHRYARMLPNADLAILICGERALESEDAYLNQDCAAAAQNLLLAAHALGLGAVWLGIYPRRERVQGIRRLLGIPDSIVPLALVAVGQPGESPAPQDRYRPERVHRERWPSPRKAP
jgi:nitroreductase